MRSSVLAFLAAPLLTAPVVAAPRPAEQPQGYSESYDRMGSSISAAGNGAPASPSTASSSSASSPATPTRQGNTTQADGYKNLLYFTNWGIYGADYQPQDLPTNNVTHILYAFADIAEDGTVESSDTYADLEKHYPSDSWNDTGNNAYGCVKQLYILKKHNRNMKVLLSIGGWTYSPKFPPIATTDSGRKNFCSSATKLVGDWGFDGIDIDWEYPANSDEAQAFTLLVQECRQSLDDYAAQNAPGYHFEISIATPAGPQHYEILDLEGMNPLVDSWNLMAYDYAGSWDTDSGHQANIYNNDENELATPFNTDQVVANFISRNIPPQSIMLGLPTYGRSFEATTGLGKPYNGIGAGTLQAGIWLYRDLPRTGASEIYDDIAKASYSYDSTSEELISYDNVYSAKEKTKYLMSKGLGGAVFWEASGDKNGTDSLVGTLASGMGALSTAQNLLSYPASQYDNIKNGMPGS